MKNMKKLWALLLALALVVALAACGTGGGNEPAPAEPDNTQEEVQTPPEDVGEPVTIMVAAAASLETAYTDTLIPMFNEIYPNITVEGTYDSSGKLQTQIEEGLAADVFMSAATKQMNALVEEGLIDEANVVPLLLNKVVLIGRAGADTDVTSFEDVLQAGTIAIGDPESVPAGQYAKEIFTNLGIYDQVEAKASLGTNVTEVLNWVAEGSADVGVVYATDAAKMTDSVVVIAEAPEGSLETPVIYPVAVTNVGTQPEAAALFVEFLQSPEAMAVLESYGFVPVS